MLRARLYCCHCSRVWCQSLDELPSTKNEPAGAFIQQVMAWLIEFSMQTSQALSSIPIILMSSSGTRRPERGRCLLGLFHATLQGKHGRKGGRHPESIHARVLCDIADEMGFVIVGMNIYSRKIIQALNGLPALHGRCNRPYDRCEHTQTGANTVLSSRPAKKVRGSSSWPE